VIRRAAFIGCVVLVGLGASEVGVSGPSTGGGSSPAAGRADEAKAEKIDGQDWPQLASGVWQLTNTVTAEKQKAKTSTLKTEACTDPSWLFATYFGPGTVERGGCQFNSWQTSTNRYRIETACMVRRVGVARMKGAIVVETPREFSMEAELLEGNKHIKIAQVGKWMSSCTH
jgi:hypothetical protein